MMKRILFIVDYFGSWPAWIDVFLLSCSRNSTVDWLIHTDCHPLENQPKNVRFVAMTFAEYCENASRKLNVRFHPYHSGPDGNATPIYNNLCDLRPTYGDLYSEEIEGYDYFGWCDVDVIFGNLRQFLTDQILTKNVITFSAFLCSGHLTLLKNTSVMRRMYNDIPRWRMRVETRAGLTPWEDCLDEAWLSRLCSPHFRSEALSLGLDESTIDRYSENNAFICEWVTPFIPWNWINGHELHPEVWFWTRGELTNWRDDRRKFPYLHLMNFEKHRYIAAELYGLQMTWQGKCAVAPNVLEAEVLRIDRTGIASLTEQEAVADCRQLREHQILGQRANLAHLPAEQVFEELRAAGVVWRDGLLTDRAGVLPMATRIALWEAETNPD